MNLEMFSQLIEEDTAFKTTMYNLLSALHNDFKETKAEILTLKSLIKPTETAPETMKIPAAAKYLNVAEVTLRGFLRDGLIPFSQLTRGGTITVQRADLDAYLSATRKKSKAEITKIANNLLGGK